MELKVTMCIRRFLMFVYNDCVVSAQRYPSVEYVFTNVPSDVDDPSLGEFQNLIKWTSRDECKK